jgi:iron complex outermembrane receptor protein
LTAGHARQRSHIDKTRPSGGETDTIGTWRNTLLALLCALAPGTARGQDAPPAAVTLPTTEVIGTSPLLGSGIDRDKVPAATRSFSDRDLRREGTADLTGTLNREVSGVNVNDVQDNPFQPDLQFRGFDASPLLGTPQGLAIYQNGVRINEAFGDTVNWDLIPDVAIDRVNLVGANPVFGLNALGGALAIEMKNGFTFQGGEGELSGGSFGRHGGSLEYGAQSGGLASYIAASGLNENGWRNHSPSQLRQLYADLGARNERITAHISFNAAANHLTALGPTPVDLLSDSRSATFTSPQTMHNDVAFLSATGAYQASDTLSFQSLFYYRSFRQTTMDGNTSDVQGCDPLTNPGKLCLDNDSTVLFDTAGQPVPDFLGGATPGSLDRTATHAKGLGGSLQATSTAPLFGRDNNLAIGASLDHGDVDFSASNELGIIAPDLSVGGTGIIVSQPDGSVTPVRVNTTNSYYGAYATDTFNLTPALAITAGGRFNVAMLRLDDRLGTSLNGNHRFSRFNPAAGATYKIIPELTAYAGYSEANRAPTAAELSCADPAHPCSLGNLLIADPPLRQVVARTYEAGLRGSLRPGNGGDKLAWNFGLYRIDNQDDIINVPSPITGRGFFQNAGNTRRQGIEAGIAYKHDRWSVSADYSLVDATFQSALTLNSPNNPFADANGQISVRPGNHLPSIPEHRLKFGTDYAVTESWTIGGSLVVASDQYLRGDESNQNPKIPGYAIVNLRSSYRLAEHFEIFGLVQNLFDQKYETFGSFFDPTQVPSLGLSNPRSLSPAAPLAAFGGVRISF